MSIASTLPTVSIGSELGSYFDKIKLFPYLTEEEEYDAALKLQKDKDIESAHLLVTSHLRLVVKIADGYRGYGLPHLEVISEGNIGLMHAVQKFDPTKGFRLATYAIWNIKAAIHEYILKSWSLVKIATTKAKRKLFFNLRSLKKKLNKFDNKQLSKDDVEKIATILDVKSETVVEMDIRLNSQDQSLNSPYFNEPGNKAELIDFLEEPRNNQETELAESEDFNYKKSLFVDAMKELNDREKDIITSRELKEPASTLQELSEKYCVSRERVRQIEMNALKKLRNIIQKKLN